MRKKLIWLLVIDFSVVGYWVYDIHPDPSISIYLIFVLPFLFCINLLLSLIVFLYQRFVAKNKTNRLALLFVYNAIISPLMFFVLFGYAEKRGIDKISKEYRFSTNGNKYILYLDLINGKLIENNRFDILEDDGTSETGILLGKYYMVKDTIYMDNDTSIHGFLPNLAYQPFQMKMFNQKLIGFPLHKSEIKLKR